MKSWVLPFLTIGLFAQTEQAPPAAAKIGRIIGEVTTKDPSSQSLTVKADNGTLYQVVLQEKTLYLRVPPGEKDLKKAAKIALADVNIGDRVLARGQVSEERKSVPAISVIVMTKEDLAKKHEADRAEWDKRGMAGKVTALNADTKEITISMKTPDGMKPVSVVTTPNTFIRRYSPDSARIADAQPSTFTALQIGDQLRLLGSKNEDGTKVTAEEIVAGTFRTLAGTVVSADAAANSIKVKDLQTQQPVIVKIGAETLLRRMPPQMAAMAARRQNAGAEGGGPGGGGPGGAPAGGAGQGAGPGGAGRRTMDIQAMLGRMPVLAVAELKPGDALLISGAGGADRSTVTALALVAGVEPILTAPQKAGRPLDLGGWSFDAGGAGAQ
jgi:hypothetical protein